jgi:hypothetical protein
MSNLPATTNFGLPVDLAGLARFADDGSEYVGDLLRCNGKTGQVTYGQQNTELPAGTELAVFVGEAQGGYIRWEDGKPALQAWVRLADPDADLDELRATLPESNPDEWQEVHPSGQPKDPLSLSIKIPMVATKTGQLFTFSSSAGSAVKSARRLIRSCIVQKRAARERTNGHVPVVTIEIGNFKTKNGAVFFPRFEVQDWVSVGVVLHSLAKTGNANAFGVSERNALNADLGDEIEAA